MVHQAELFDSAERSLLLKILASSDHQITLQSDETYKIPSLPDEAQSRQQRCPNVLEISENPCARIFPSLLHPPQEQENSNQSPLTEAHKLLDFFLMPY